MNVNCYLPDELAERAKTAGLNLSGLLRASVTDELDRRQVLAESAEGASEHELDLRDDEGRSYVGRIVGSLIVDENDHHGGGSHQVFLAEDERVFLYDPGAETVVELAPGDEQEQLSVLCKGAYVEAMHALGLTPRVDL